MPTALVRPLRLRCGDANRKVTWLELFFDLIFVAAVAQVGSPLAGDYSAGGLVRFALLFLLIWWAWSGSSTFNTRFDTDDLIQRALTLVQVFAVAAMAVNATESLASRDSAGFAAAYAAVRFVLVFQYFRARRVPESRALTTWLMTGHAIAAAVWLVSALVEPPARFAMWGIALAIDLGTPMAALRHSVDVPPDAAHLPERYGLFTLILLGESVVAVMKGMESQADWSPAAAVAAFLGMCIAFSLWWWYFDGVSGAAERFVRSKRDATLLHAWSYAHLPLYLGIAVAGVGVEHVVSGALEAHLHAAESWILCGSLGLVMCALTTIAATSEGAQSHPRLAMHLAPQYAIGAATVMAGSIGHLVPPVMLLGLLTALCLVQLGLALRGPACVHAPLSSAEHAPA